MLAMLRSGSLHHGGQHGRSAARRERLQSVLAYPFLGVCQEDFLGVARCNLFADWSGLDLVHVRCMTPGSVRSKEPNATAPSSVRSRQANAAAPSGIRQRTKHCSTKQSPCIRQKVADGVIPTCGLI